MKVLIFTDGTKFNVNDESTITLISLTVADFKTVDTIKNNLTIENMKSVTLDSETYTEVIPESIIAKKENDVIQVSIQNRLKTFEEKVSEILNEHADALMELAEATNG